MNLFRHWCRKTWIQLVSVFFFMTTYLPHRKIVLPHVFGQQKWFQNLCPQGFVPNSIFLKILFPKVLSPLNFSGILELRFFSVQFKCKKTSLNFVPVSYCKISKKYIFLRFTTKFLATKVLDPKISSKVCSSIVCPQSHDLKIFFPTTLSPSKMFVLLDSESRFF